MAGTSDLVDRLGKATRPVKIMVLAGVLLLFGVVYYFLLYSDMSTEYDDTSTAKDHLIEQERGLIKRKSEYDQLLKDKANVEEMLQKNSIKLPGAAEVPAFYQDLETQADTANVRIVTRSLEKEVPVDSFFKVPVKMEVVADFYQLNQYFKLLNDTARIITIENMFIGNAQRVGNHLELTARFTASTFRMADQQQQQQAGPTPQGPTAAPPTPGPAPPAPPKPAEALPASVPAAPAPATKGIPSPAPPGGKK